VHSANNFADVLARWDAGSVPAFVAQMNAEAAALGMTATHYTDANGLDPTTVGSAVDELRVAAAAMAIPTFAAVVDQQTVTLPIAGPLPNYVQEVGTDGIVGVKSGFTQAAMGCLVLAGVRTVAGKPVIVLAAVTGQPGDDPLDTANAVDLRLINAAAGGLRQATVTPAGAHVGVITVAWSRRSVATTTTGALTVLVWPGQVIRLGLAHAPVRAGSPAGERVGTLTATVGPERVAVAVRADAAVTGPTARWRLTRR
jgi:serine-type D-Ala-D-Ala carboxypeptidase (penicillin-binding protein 5/6)